MARKRGGGGEGGLIPWCTLCVLMSLVLSIKTTFTKLVIRLIVLAIEHWQSTHQLMSNLLKAHSHVDWPVNLSSFYAKFKIRFWVKTAENSCKCLDRKVRSKCNSLLVWMESISSCICSYRSFFCFLKDCIWKGFEILTQLSKTIVLKLALWTTV